MCKNYSRYLLLLCTLFSSGSSYARIVTAEEAKAEAARFFNGAGCMRLAETDAFKLVHTAKDAKGVPSYYIFNAKDSKGFAIMAADDAKQMVVGFSMDGQVDPQALPAAMTKTLQNLPDATPASKAVQRRAKAKLPAGASWRGLLTTAQWSQEGPFNNQIPGRKLTGCVATALATVMKYYNYPAKGKGSAGGADFNVNYDWTNMRMDNYRNGYSQTEADAVSTLMWHAAASILTDFGQSSSSAFEIRVPSALINHFGYDAGVSYKKRSEVDADTWNDIIINEIANKRPVILSGQDVASGHAFVIDGYEVADKFCFYHVNWGWGGAKGNGNGYFSYDALNPTLSKAHSYNDQQTIIYNIKPATSQTVWSGIHITNDNNQPGLTIDQTDLWEGDKFTLRAGALKNIENSDFNGKLVVALYDESGNRKCLLSAPRSFSLPTLQVENFVDFNCQVPKGVWVDWNDRVRLATQVAGQDEWLPVAAELIVAGDARVMAGQLSTFNVNTPQSDANVSIEAPSNQVIKGRDFTFKVTPLAKGNVVTVKSNGFILTPVAANTYRIANVTCNQDVKVLVQNEADVVSKRSLWVNAGKLSTLLNEEETATVKNLTLFGTVNASDFSFMRDKMKLQRVDLSGVQIVAEGSNAANAIPANAFNEVRSLQEVILPSSVNAIKTAAFRYTGLKKIEIPAGVSKYEYNIFVGCGSLHEVVCRRANPEWINWCVFSGCPRTKLVVPVGASARYAAKDEWKLFKSIVEENPVAASSYTVDIQDAKGVKITPLQENSSVAAGSEYKFRVDTDGSEGDATVEVYASRNRLYPDARGVYTALVNSNTLIYTTLRQPVAAATNSVWQLNGTNDGVGLSAELINFPINKSFTIRANNIAVPSNAGNIYYAAVLTDGKGGVKEVISPATYNGTFNVGNKELSLTCQIKESTIKEGNTIMLATSLDRKIWSLVRSNGAGVREALPVIGNKVVFHSVTFADQPNAVVEGKATEIVRGMPYSFKVVPLSDKDAVSVTVNGKIWASGVSVANITLPSVNSDLNINIQVAPATSNTYINIDVAAGELASKLGSQQPRFLKVSGSINHADFAALRNLKGNVIGLDLSSVNIVGNLNEQNTIPSKAFDGCSNLEEVMLPSGISGIADNAFSSVSKIKELMIPKDVSYIGAGAFAACTSLTKIVVLNRIPAKLYAEPFPKDNKNKIELITPSGTASAYANAGYWNGFKVSGVEYYSVSIDKTRLYQYGSQDISRVTYPAGQNYFTIAIGMPNSLAPSDKNVTMRPGVAFKIYLDGRDVMKLDNWDSSKQNPFGTITKEGTFGGQYIVDIDSRITNPAYAKYPSSHDVTAVFYYALNFNVPTGVKVSMVEDETDDQKVWRKVPWNYFNASGNSTLYSEGKSHQFKLAGAPTGFGYKVKCSSRVCTKPGSNNARGQITPPVYETREFEAPCDENGVYTILNLQGDTQIAVTLVPTEGAKLTAEEVKSVDAETAKDMSAMSLSNTLDDATIKAIREKFVNLESLDMSEVQNTSLPDNAFKGMTKLASVSIPDNVNSIGAGAFDGCTSLETLTLNGVSSIGEGAFAGCRNLTSVVINTRNATRAGNNISASSFAGANPNLIVMVADAEMAAAIGSGVNVVLNGNGSRTAMTDINIKAGVPFNAPVGFTLNGKGISCEFNVKSVGTDPEAQWHGLLLPFAPKGVDISGAETRAGRSSTPLSIYSFTDSGAEKLSEESVANLKANVPYLMQYRGAAGAMNTLKFTAQGVVGATTEDVPATPVAETIKNEGALYTLFGSYEALTAGEKDMLLDLDGRTFRLIDAQDGERNIAPFGVYARSNDNSGADFKISESLPTGVKDVYGVATNGLEIRKEGSLLVVSASAVGEVTIYNAKGEVVTVMRLAVGDNSIQLPRGLYIVGDVKVIF